MRKKREKEIAALQEKMEQLESIKSHGVGKKATVWVHALTPANGTNQLCNDEGITVCFDETITNSKPHGKRRLWKIDSHSSSSCAPKLLRNTNGDVSLCGRAGPAD